MGDSCGIRRGLRQPGFHEVHQRPHRGKELYAQIVVIHVNTEFRFDGKDDLERGDGIDAQLVTEQSLVVGQARLAGTA